MSSRPVLAVVAPGDMGHGLAAAFVAAGYRVVTALEGRSARSRELARKAGMEDAGGLAEAVRQADLFLSVLPPDQALPLARSVATAMRAQARKPVYCDLNAVSPHTVQQIAATIGEAGGRFADGGIIGLNPQKDANGTRLYVSGPARAQVLALAAEGVRFKDLGEEVGRASALKMCYAALTKGRFSLYATVASAVAAMGLEAEWRAEMEGSQKATLQQIDALVPRLPADAARWVPEMQEIAESFEAVGLSGHFHRGAGDILSLLARTPFAAESRETLDPTRSLADTVAAVLAARDGPDGPPIKPGGR